MSNDYNHLSSISWQLKRIADALEEMNEMNKPKPKAINVIEEIQKRNNGPRVWTKSEQQRLTDLLDENKSVKEIADILDRTEGAIRSRIRNHVEKNGYSADSLRAMLKTKSRSSFDDC